MQDQPLWMPNKYEMPPSPESLDKCFWTTSRSMSSVMISQRYSSSLSLSFHWCGSKCQNSCNASNLCFCWISVINESEPFFLVYTVMQVQILLRVVLPARLTITLSQLAHHFRCTDSRVGRGCHKSSPGKRINSSILPKRSYFPWTPFHPKISAKHNGNTMNESARPCFVICRW